MTGSIRKIRAFFFGKSVLVRFVLINVAAFAVIHVVAISASLAGSGFDIIRLLQLPPSALETLRHPWSVISYMFTHYDLLHILFNLLWLYCFGIIFLDHFKDREFIAAYFIGGVSGALFYLAGNGLLSFPTAGLLGSSASVLAVASAAVVRAPDYRINLFLIGMVKIKWVAAFCLVFMLLSAGAHNLGSQFAHLGGIVAGSLFALNARYGWIKTGKVRKGRILPKLHERPVVSQARIEAELDTLLEKVRQSGYNALSDQEKQDLNELSKRIKI